MRARRPRPGSIERRRLVALGALCLLLAGAVPGAGDSLVVAGSDRVLVGQVSDRWAIEPYWNNGYRLTVDGEGLEVRVDLRPLASDEPFFAPAVGSGAGDPLFDLAKRLTAGAVTRFEAVGRILRWVRTNVGYELDRSADQSAAAVFHRRTAYCTGFARLAVALLDRAGIRSREVPGYVLESEPGGAPAGFHRWIEVDYGKTGWAFSDPAYFHHYVPATYLRLASEKLPRRWAARAALELVAAGRHDRREVIDALPGGPGEVTMRANDERRFGAALRIDAPGHGEAQASLVGEGRRHRRALDAGRGIFVGLEPGEYLLRLARAGGDVSERRVQLRERKLYSITLAPPVVADGSGRTSQ